MPTEAVLDPASIATVADNLLRFTDDIAVDEWAECEQARTRSAASRGYYSVLLAVKRRVLALDPDFDFPTRGVHGTVRIAVGRSLGERSFLFQSLRILWDARVHADYDLVGTVSLKSAEDYVDRALDALSGVGGLTDADVRKIAQKILAVKVERERS